MIIDYRCINPLDELDCTLYLGFGGPVKGLAVQSFISQKGSFIVQKTL